MERWYDTFVNDTNNYTMILFQIIFEDLVIVKIWDNFLSHKFVNS